ncbi:hypothetical protein C2G38_2190179 [Gigaspora rosea]|uniref:Protein kinase domain-containing protein n=1 Tax=Gigaspora rosea TaxID=44941 RepID=A0A397V8R2_9GLOM|nr:hypothetical protein C2G38_2190179 [Gigaspora rosea]
MVLKYVNGGNLRDYLRDNFKNDEYKLKFVEQIYCAKDLAHGLGFLRKESDLHSKNILIHNKQLMIADLGLFK